MIRRGTGRRPQRRMCASARLQAARRTVRTPPGPLRRQFREPALDQIHLGAIGRGDVKTEAGMAPQPPLNRRGAVGGDVVQDDMHCEFIGHALVDFARSRTSLPPGRTPARARSAAQPPINGEAPREPPPTLEVSRSVACFCVGCLLPRCSSGQGYNVARPTTDHRTRSQPSHCRGQYQAGG